MRTVVRAAWVVLLASSAPLPLLAAEVAATSRVDAVTVFLAGAEVTRLGKVKLDKGEHTIVLGDLPASAVPESIRVDGKATGKLSIGSVDTARKLLQRAESQAADAERKRLEDLLEQLRDQRAAVEGQAQAAETQKALIANLAQLPTRPPAVQGVAAGEDWPRVLGVIAQGATDATRLALDAQVKQRQLDRQIDDAERQLVALAPPRTDQTEVRVHVIAETPLDVDLTVRYQVADAHWAPVYDARLETGTKTLAPKLELARRAAITQKTGESWEEVALQLSTARPAEGASAPVVEPQTVDFEQPLAPVPPPQPMVRRMAPGTDAAKDALSAETEAAATAGAAPASAPVEEVTSAITSAPFEASFSVPGRATVTSNGVAKRVLLMSDQIDPALFSRTVPKADAAAYLYAKIKFEKGTPLLPGKVYLFRDGTFVGTGALPLLPPGEEHDLGFGVDDQVKVRHAVLEEKRGETGLISTSRTDSRNYRVTVKNLHERPIEVTVVDRVPVSLNQDIKVEFTGRVAPTKENVDNKRGVMNFLVKLEPDEEKQLDYGYRISWPAAKSITLGP